MQRTRIVSRLAAAAWAVLLLCASLPAAAAALSPGDGEADLAGDGARRAAAIRTLGNLPLSFAENRGQWDSRVRYKARTRDGELFVARDNVVLTMPSGPERAAVIRLRPLGARPGLEPKPGQATGSPMHFFLGNDRTKWRTDVPTYDAVVYEAVYPGIDLRYHGDNHLLEYDFLVAPGANPGRIRMGLQGARDVRLDPDGAMTLTLADGRELRQAAPVIYQQEENGVRTPVAGKFRLFRDRPGSGRVFGFELAAYDATRPLVIDPTLAYSSYLGGASSDYAYAVTAYVTAGASHAVVAGSTLSTTFPDAVSVPGTVRALGDVFVARFDNAGALLDYSAIIGGSQLDEARGVAVDSLGQAYVTGYTKSTNFPTSSALWPSLSGAKEDAFILALNAAGNDLIFSTYYGGSGSDFGNAIALDGAGSIYVAGTAGSTDLPVKNALYPTSGGYKDGFLLKMSATGALLSYATYFGGEKDDEIYGLVVTPEGDAFIGGSTLSVHLPVKNAIQPALGLSTTMDGFVARINPTCTELVFSTYLGGAGTDWVNAIALDPSRNIVLTGTTNSTNFPTVNALYATLAGGYDAFVTVVDSSGRFLRFSTYLGGAGDDAGNGVAVDQVPDNGSSYIYVGGQTASSNFPTTNAWSVTTSSGALQNGFGYRGAVDGFVTKIEPHGARLVYSSYLGGTGADIVNAVATGADATRAVFLVGQTTSPSPSATVLGTSAFPITAGVRQTAFGGVSDAFATRVTDTSYATDVPWLSLNFPTAAPLVGTSVAMTLTYTDSAPASTISAVSTTLTYNPTVLEPIGVVKNPAAIYNNYTLEWQDDGSGTLRLMLYQNAGAATALAAGTLATITFRVKYASGSVLSRVTNTPTASNTASSDAPISGQAGLVQISQRCGQLGDCDCSGAVQLWEAQQAARKLLGQIPQDACVMTDYTTMTASDLQQIVNNHLYRVAALGAPAGLSCPAGGDAPASARLALGPAGSVGGAMTVPLRLAAGGQTLSALVSDIEYDPALYSDVQVAAGAVVTAAGKDVMSYVREPGKLRVVVIGMSNRQGIADGEVARLTFTAQNGLARPRGILRITSTAAAPDATAVPVSGGGSLGVGALQPVMQLLITD